MCTRWRIHINAVSKALSGPEVNDSLDNSGGKDGSKTLDNGDD